MPDLYSCELGWYALKAATKREHVAAELLRREAEVEVFCPRIAFPKKTKRGKVRFVEALFPGYLFVRAELKDQYRHFLSISGITGLVRYGDRVPRIPDAFIAELRERLSGEEETHEEAEVAVRVGQEVTMLEGPFKDWQAMVQGLFPAKDRVAVLIDFMGRMLELEVSSNSILVESEENLKKRTFGR